MSLAYEVGKGKGGWPEVAPVRGPRPSRRAGLILISRLFRARIVLLNTLPIEALEAVPPMWRGLSSTIDVDRYFLITLA